jgi:DNA-binding transcriptional MerR regulator
MTPDTPKRAPEVTESPAKWLFVSEAAAACGVSIRTVKRWIENGEVETRKDGARRLVSMPQKRDTEGTKATRQKGHEGHFVSPLSPSHAQKEGHKGHKEGTQSVSPLSLSTSISSEREAELKEEISFLRGIVESDRRDMAELRAALREALKAMPKALQSGAPSGDLEQLGTENGRELTQVNAEKSARDSGELGQVGTDSQATATAPEAPTATAISPDVVLPVEPSSGAELGEIDDLIYKVFGR